MDTQTLIAINFIVLVIALIVLLLYLRKIYQRGKRVNRRKPEVRERYDSLVLKHNKSDKKLIAFLESKSGKFTVIGIIAFIIIALLIILGKWFNLNADHYMVILTFTAILITTFTFYRNQKFLQKQQFESTFFNMMKQLEDIVSKIMIDYSVGRDAFCKFYNDTEIVVDDWKFVEIINDECFEEETKKYSKNTDNFGIIFDKIISSKENSFTVKNLRYLIENFGIRGFECSKKKKLFDHYFRYLTTILQFIDESSFLDKDQKFIDERYKYANILRSTLSSYELVILFYYGLTCLGKDFKPLAERYSLFMYFDTSLLAVSRRDKYLKLYEGISLYDGERYKSNKKGIEDKYFCTIYVKDSTLFKNK